MSNIFAKKKAAKGSSKVEDDYVGGGGALDTDIYNGTVKYAYIGSAQNSDAKSVTICVKTDKGEVTETIWVTNRDGDITYKDKKSGDLHNLPGYNQVNSIAMLLTGKEMGDLEVDSKTLNLYNFEKKKEVPTEVDCFVELHDVEVQVAVQRQTIDKTKKNDQTGEYEPTGDTRDINVFVKFFPSHALVTLSEVTKFIEDNDGDFDDVLEEGNLLKAIEMIEEDGAYAGIWLDKYQGQTYDKSSGSKSSGKSFGGGNKSGGAEKKKSSLFDC